jgi:hypothetical protein
MQFLENPTAQMRVAAFEALGGFPNFGERLRNRCGLDTEFALRAYYAGARFAMSREVVVRYRCHTASVTQDNVSGWGTPPRRWSEAECQRRLEIFRQRSFAPRDFGALREAWGHTRRVQVS